MKTFKFFALVLCLASATSFAQTDKPCSFTKLGPTKYILNDDFSTEGYTHVTLFVGMDAPDKGIMSAYYIADDSNIFNVDGLGRFGFLTSDDMSENGFVKVLLHGVTGGDVKIVEDEKVVCESIGTDAIVSVDKLLK